MRPSERLALALVVAFGLSSVCLFPTTQDRQYLALIGVLVVSSALIGVIVRRLGGGHALATFLQLAPGVAAWFLTVGMDPMPWLVRTWSFVAASVAPMPPDNGFLLASGLGLWVLFLVGDLVSVPLKEPVWVFPILFVPYLVPAIGIRAGVSAWWACLPAAGYLVVLVADVTGRGSPHAARTRACAAWAALTGVVACACAMTVSAAIPPTTPWWMSAPGGTPSVVMNDPSQNLIRDLRESAAQPVLSYTTDVPGGVYLRLAALPVFDTSGFHLAATSLTPVSGWDRQGAWAPGAPQHTVSVSISGLESEWLPTPAGMTGLEAAGQWSYDPATGNVTSIAADRQQATHALQYSAQFNTRVNDPSATFAPGDPGDGGVTLSLPSGLAGELRAQADAVTTGATNASQQIQDLLNWFDSGTFTYTTASVDGTTTGTLEDFLFGSRTGYCEQFAASMALLARSLGIPSRMVVGFLPGTQQADGTWQVTTHQTHAWTELYLRRTVTVDGQNYPEEGWFSVDPTPAADVGRPTATPPPTATPQATPTPTRTPTTHPASTPTAIPTTPSTTAPAGANGSTPLWWWLLPAALVVIAAGACVPYAIRTRRRRTRLRGTGPVASQAEDAWDEVRDTILDAGMVWPGGTPRHVAATVPLGGTDASQALSALALMVEQARYAPAVTGTDPAALARAITASLDATTSRWRRWWPASLWHNKQAD